MSLLESCARGTDDARELLRTLVAERDVDGMVVIGLDARGRPSGVGVNPKHRALSFVRVWELRALATELDASALVVVLFPHLGDGPPSAHELECFVDLRSRAHRAQVHLADCIVVRGERSWSLRQLVAEPAAGRLSPQSRPSESDL